MKDSGTSTEETCQLEGHECQKCGKPAALQCPKCLELKLEQEFSTFCSQDCFKVSFKQCIYKPD
jgi:methionyl aminopeptidase